MDMPSMGADKESLGITHTWKYKDCHIYEKDMESPVENGSMRMSTVKTEDKSECDEVNLTGQMIHLDKDSSDTVSRLRQVELRLHDSTVEKRSCIEEIDRNANNEKVALDKRETESNNNLSHDDELEDADKVRTTAFSVTDILDPNKFVGCNSVPRVWHPWIRDEGVRDYSRSNLERDTCQSHNKGWFKYF